MPVELGHILSSRSKKCWRLSTRTCAASECALDTCIATHERASEMRTADVCHRVIRLHANQGLEMKGKVMNLISSTKQQLLDSLFTNL